MIKKYLPDIDGEMEECDHGDYVTLNDYIKVREELDRVQSLLNELLYKRDKRYISLPHRG